MLLQVAGLLRRPGRHMREVSSGRQFMRFGIGEELFAWVLVVIYLSSRSRIIRALRHMILQPRRFRKALSILERPKLAFAERVNTVDSKLRGLPQRFLMRTRRELLIHREGPKKALPTFMPCKTFLIVLPTWEFPVSRM
jgi:hypothetical protein